MPVAPYPVGSTNATLAPSSSSSLDLRPELLSGFSTDASSNLSSANSSSASIGSTFSRSGAIPEFGIHHSEQGITSSIGGSSSNQEGEAKISSWMKLNMFYPDNTVQVSSIKQMVRFWKTTELVFPLGNSCHGSNLEHDVSIRAAFSRTCFPENTWYPRSPPDSVVLTPLCHSIIRRNHTNLGWIITWGWSWYPPFFCGDFWWKNLIFIRLITGKICILAFIM